MQEASIHVETLGKLVERDFTLLLIVVREGLLTPAVDPVSVRAAVDELVQPQPMTIAVIMANSEWVKGNKDLVQRYFEAPTS